MTLDDTNRNIRTHDLILNNFGKSWFKFTISFLKITIVYITCIILENKVHVLPLFGHFCCRLAIQPDCITKEVRIGFITINDQRYWARLQGFEIEAWKSKKAAEGLHEPNYKIGINKVRWKITLDHCCPM